MYFHSYVTEEETDSERSSVIHGNRLVKQQKWSWNLDTQDRKPLALWCHMAVPELWQSLKPYSYAGRNEVGMILKWFKSDVPTASVITEKISLNLPCRTQTFRVYISVEGPILVHPIWDYLDMKAGKHGPALCLRITPWGCSHPLESRSWAQVMLRLQVINTNELISNFLTCKKINI